MENFEEEYGIWEGFTYKTRNQKSSKLVSGIGINNSPFVTNPVGLLRHPAYQYWKSMLTRCACIKLKEREPSYKEVTCCEEWLYFTNFAKWFKDNYIKGWQLDKDILVKDNRIYAPDTCIFIPQEINLFISIKRGNSKLPIGVQEQNNKFIARDGATRKYFSSALEAHKDWQIAKYTKARGFNFAPLTRIKNQLLFDICNNLETISL